MSSVQLLATIHHDYLPFVELASDTELAAFVRAQIRQALQPESKKHELPGLAAALLDTHNALIKRLEEASRKKSQAGKMGGNPNLKRKEHNAAASPAAPEYALSRSALAGRPDAAASPAAPECALSRSALAGRPDAAASPAAPEYAQPPLNRITPLPKPSTFSGTTTISGTEESKPLRAVRAAFTFGDALTSAVDDWLSYKTEKRQPYKPTGLKSLLREITEKAAKYGEKAVAAMIQESMACNYQGLMWDKIKPVKPSVASERSDPFYEIAKEACHGIGN